MGSEADKAYFMPSTPLFPAATLFCPFASSAGAVDNSAAEGECEGEDSFHNNNNDEDDHSSGLSELWNHPRPSVSIAAFIECVLEEFNLVRHNSSSSPPSVRNGAEEAVVSENNGEPCVVAAATMLVQRLQDVASFALDLDNVYLVWAVALLITCKVFLDKHFNNKSMATLFVHSAYKNLEAMGDTEQYAQDLKFATRAINDLELEFLERVRYDVVTPQEFCRNIISNGDTVTAWHAAHANDDSETTTAQVAKDLGIAEWSRFTPFQPSPLHRWPLWHLLEDAAIFGAETPSPSAAAPTAPSFLSFSSSYLTSIAHNYCRDIHSTVSGGNDDCDDDDGADVAASTRREDECTFHMEGCMAKPADAMAY